MPSRTIIGTKIQEGETWLYSTVIVDEAGAAIDLTAATVDGFISFYNKLTPFAAINTRNNQQFLTAGVASNEHTVDASGNLAWKAEALDSVPTGGLDTAVVARYTITYQDGAAVARVAIHEVEFTIEVLPTVT